MTALPSRVMVMNVPMTTFNPKEQEQVRQMLIGQNFVFCGEMNTLPTASQPVSDLMTYPRNRSAAFPHAKRQLKSVASTDPSAQSHFVMTTGAVTKPKIVPRKALM